MKSRTALVIILFLSIITLLAPYATRTMQGNDSFPGADSYFHLGIAQNMLLADKDLYPLPAVPPTVFHVLVSALIEWTTPALVGKILPWLLGLLTVTGFYASSKVWFKSVEQRSLVMLMLIITPLFIITHTTFSPAALALCLLIVGWWCFQRWPSIGGFCIVLVSLVDISAFAAGGLLFLAFTLYNDQWRESVVILIAGITISLISWFGFGYVAYDSTLSQHIILLQSFGGFWGYSFFILMLGIIGAVVNWRKKWSGTAIIITLLFVASWHVPMIRIVLLPVIAGLAAQGVWWLWQKEWAVDRIRQVTMLLVILSLLFSVLVVIKAQTEREPSVETLSAMQFLRTTKQADFVLSRQDNGFLIERIAKRKAFIDPLSDTQHMIEADDIFHNIRYKQTAALLEKNNITHILIDQEMVDGDVWTHSDQGLLFLAENNDHFVKVYDREEYRIYRFVNE